MKTDYKFVPFDELPALRARHRDKKIVQCHGAFDLVHMGHLIHFEEAKSFGDLLVVTITGDRYITKKRSITFPEEYRRAAGRGARNRRLRRRRTRADGAAGDRRAAA